MKLPETPSSLELDAFKFDLLRARLEAELERPAVIAVTSSTAEDGKDVAAWGLARSLAATGYSTVFIDASVSAATITEPAERLRFDAIASQVSPSQGAASFAVLTLSDPALQKTSSQRNVVSAFQILRSKFDYVVISTECALFSSFATAVVTAADSVLLAVRIGRRERDHDARLSAALEHIGPRFLGIVALDPAIIKASTTIASTPATSPPWRLRQTAQAAKESQRREVAEWPT